MYLLYVSFCIFFQKIQVLYQLSVPIHVMTA